MKNKTIIIVLIIVSTVLFNGCPPNNDINYPKGKFPTTPVNFGDLNSEYDDYNSGPPPTLENHFNLYYSSNRNSFGKSFNIIGAELYYVFNMHNGNFNFTAYELSDDPYKNELFSINLDTSSKLGPNFYQVDDSKYVMFWASNKNGNLDIYYLIKIYNSDNNNYTLIGPYNLDKLNSTGDDGYLTLNQYKNEIYFTSNRNGNFDIFMTGITVNIIEWLEGSYWAETSSVDILNSPYDDKCPYINGNLMVFTSNRPGGYGGYDLWYSKYVNGAWTTPKNFGSDINSSSDEYRPVAILADNFENDLMIFSSNRPGGKGGFDLYYVGIPKNLIGN